MTLGFCEIGKIVLILCCKYVLWKLKKEKQGQQALFLKKRGWGDIFFSVLHSSSSNLK